MTVAKKATRPHDLVAELAGRDITLTLHLASGRDVRGTLVNVASDRNGSVALMTNPRVPNEVTHVSLDTLVAVTLYDAHLIGAPPVPDPQPGKLELKRLLAALTEKLGFAFESDALELPEAGALAAALPLIEEALVTIRSDAMGKGALAPIKRVVLAVTTTAGVMRDGNALTISCARDYSARPNAKQWRDHLERVL